MIRIKEFAEFLGSHSNWILIACAPFLVGGAITSPIVTLHWMSRLLIAIGLVLFTAAAVSKLSVDRIATPGQRVAIVMIGILALIAAVDEVLPDPYRSSTVLLVLAGLIGLLLLAWYVMRDARPSKSRPRR